MIEAAPVTPDFASLHPGYTFAKWVCAKNKAGSTTCLSSLSALALNVTVAWHSSGAQAPSPRPSPQWREGDEGRAAGTMSFVLPHANGGGGPSEAAQQRRMVEGAFVVRLNNPSTTCIRRSSRPTHRTRARSPSPLLRGGMQIPTGQDTMHRSVETKEAAELLRIGARRTETIRRMRAVAVTYRNRAKQHLLRGMFTNGPTMRCMRAQDSCAQVSSPCPRARYISA